MRRGEGRFRFLPSPRTPHLFKTTKRVLPFWITRGSENLRFHVLFGIVHEMSDDREIVDRRRKKRIGVSKKFCTSVHLYEHRPPDGCVSVCRGEHRSSAAGANDNTTPMQIRNTQPCTNLHRRVVFSIVTSDKRCLSLRARMDAGVYLRVRWGSDVPL